MPRTPVQALALPLFRITALIGPFLMWAWHTRTGPAFTWFVVKAPAASAGRAETTNARSFSRPGLIPAWCPAARNPFGDVTVPFRSQTGWLTSPVPPLPEIRAAG